MIDLQIASYHWTGSHCIAKQLEQVHQNLYREVYRQQFQYLHHFCLAAERVKHREHPR